MGLLYRNVGQKGVIIERSVSGNIDIRDFMTWSFRDLIDDRLAIGLLLRVYIYLRVKVAFRLKVRDQVCPAFLNNFRIRSDLLINRKQLLLRPAPDVRALDFYMIKRSAFHAEGDVSAVAAGVVVG